MSRKTAIFDQLVGYCLQGMNNTDSEYSIFHNMHPGGRDQIISDFVENAGYMNERSNGVQMYHEILSLTRSEVLTNDQQKVILQEAVQEYLSERAPDCMAVSVIHDEKENNIHAHIVLSANPVFSAKRHRLSKHEFEEVKRNAERYVLENHPEMQQEVTIDKSPEQRISNAESELKRRGGRTTQKDKMRADLQSIFNSARSQEELENALTEQGLAMSFRKNNSEPRFGKADSKKHFRLKTLGLDIEYAKLQASFEEDLAIESEIEQEIKHDGGKSKTDAIKAFYAERVREGSITETEATNKSRESSQKKQTDPERHPWAADISERQRALQEPSARDKTEKVAKEWFAGDFETRDREATREKYRKQNEADKKVRPNKDQSATEYLAETAKEWFTGDFSARDSRTRTEKFNKLKRDSKTVKDKSDQSKTERIRENFNEYVKGDFSARDARALKRKQEKGIERKQQAEQEAQKSWMKSEGVDLDNQEKVDNWEKTEIEKRKSELKKSRRDSSSRDKDNDRER